MVLWNQCTAHVCMLTGILCSSAAGRWG